MKNKHLRKKLYNMKQVVNVSYNREESVKDVLFNRDRLELENFVGENTFNNNDEMYLKSNIIFHFVDGSIAIKYFDNDDEMGEYFEMLETRYNLIDLSKGF